MAILYLLVGIPASGKSTWAAEQMKLNDQRENKLVYVSRDKIRFSMLSDVDQYFAHEKEVFCEFVRQIQEGLDGGHNVIADATHLNEASRNKLLDKLKLNNVNVCPIIFITDLHTCIERNSLRMGRARVPDSVLEMMYVDFIMPSYQEKYKYAHIFIIDDNHICSIL